MMSIPRRSLYSVVFTILAALLGLTMVLDAPAARADERVQLFNLGDDWRYFKGTAEPPSNWKLASFNDGSWSSGPSGFGFGDGDDATILSDMRGNYLSVYVRGTFEVSDPAAVSDLILNIDYDDGYLAYINGVRVGISNLPNGASHSTAATRGHEAHRGYDRTVRIKSSLLQTGANVLAIQVHNQSLSSNDLSLLPELSAATFPDAPASTSTPEPTATPTSTATPNPTPATGGGDVGAAGGAVSSPPAGAIVIRTNQDARAVVRSNPNGSTYWFESGVHHAANIEPGSNDRLLGAPGAVLTGAVDLDGFSYSNGQWSASAPARSPDSHGKCERVDGASYTGCTYPEQLFVDGQPLWRVTSRSAVASGKWYFDYASDRVYLADDPRGHDVELSVSSAAISRGGTNVVIEGLTIRRYANQAQFGAIKTGRGWRVEHVTIEYTHGCGIKLEDDVTIRSNLLHHNGHIGICGSADDALVELNEVAYNNTAGYAYAWSNGGIKVGAARDVVFRANYVHHNTGPGLWADVESERITYEANIVEWNTGDGIKYEVSYDGLIIDNVVRYNGLRKDVWLWGSQILIQNSGEVEVRGNTVTVHSSGGNGIGVVNQNRGTGTKGPKVSRNALVIGNLVIHEGNTGRSGIADGTKWACGSSANNRFVGNEYQVPNVTATRWNFCGARTFSGVQALGHELTGSVHN